MTGEGEPLSLREMAGVLAEALYEAGTRIVYGVPGGGANLDVVGAAEAVGCRFVLTHTEAAATIMAAVTGEQTATPGAAVVTRGPGAASAVNGAAQAYLDRQPLLLITDCVTEADRPRVSHQRLDQAALFRPVTKGSVRLGSVGTRSQARQAVGMAVSGRPGPVHVDVDPSPRPGPQLGTPEGTAGPSDPVRALTAEARGLVLAARRPVVIAGVGALIGSDPAAHGGCVSAVRRLATALDVPVLTTYKGRGVVADSSGHAAGVMTGARIESALLGVADLIIGVGLDPVELIPGPWTYQAPVLLIGPYQIDDSSFFGDSLRAEMVGDVAAILDDLSSVLQADWSAGAGAAYRQEALTAIATATPPSPAAVTPQEVVVEARAAAPPGTIATVDAGAHMLAAVPLWQVEEPGELLISSGLATMGFALPAAIAAALVHPERRVICFTGDGGLGMALGELETLARLALRVTVVVFNDSSLSLIAIKQKPQGNGGTGAVNYRKVDYAAVASACGLSATLAVDLQGYRRALKQTLELDGPSLIDVSVDPSGYPDIMKCIRG